MIRPFLPLMILLTSILLSVTPSLADTIHVPGDQPTIQAALDVAMVGDLVLVAPGTYTGPGNKQLDFLGKDVELRSAAGAAQTTIDLQDSGRLATFRHVTAAAVVDGFTIRNGNAGYGSGIYTRDTAAPTIMHCVFTGCFALGDGGVCEAAGTSAPQFLDCTFSDNESGAGGVLAALGNSSPSFVDCELIDNRAPVGGAITAEGTTVLLRRCVIAGSVVPGDGGAIHCRTGAAVTLIQCQLVENTANTGGGIFAFHSEIDLAGCTLVGNFGFAGGGVYLNDSHASIVDCTFYGNEAVAGNCVLLSHGATATMSNTIFSFGAQGEAIHCSNAGPVELDCCDVFGNAGGDWVGCIAGQLGQDGNISDAPLFCGAAAGDFTIEAASPCAPPQSGGCGLIGAWDVGCGVTPAAATSWGAIKTIYR